MGRGEMGAEAPCGKGCGVLGGLVWLEQRVKCRVEAGPRRREPS